MQRDSFKDFGAARLGFGCAGLHGAVSRNEAIVLLETALDNGITHFDTARVYGWGAAERMLGDLARRRRAEMVIVSKAGIAPPSIAGRLLKKIAGRFSPSLAAAGESAFGLFGGADITQSVETSLAALGTDRLDALLLHEIEPDHVTDELKRALEALKQSGKVLRVGLATNDAATAAIAAAHPELCAVVQVAAPPVGVGAPKKQGVRILHSVLGQRLSDFAAQLNTDPQRAARFARETACDPADRGALARLLLKRAARDGMALFSSTRAANIAANATLLGAANDCEQLQGFDRFLAAA